MIAYLFEFNILQTDQDANSKTVAGIRSPTFSPAEYCAIGSFHLKPGLKSQRTRIGQQNANHYFSMPIKRNIFTSQPKLQKSIVFVGMMGSGKSAVGQAVASKLDVDFFDSDHEIERVEQLSIPEIFSKFGENHFREREATVIEKLLTGPPCAISTGGGTFVFMRNKRLIQTNAVSIWLKAGLDLLWERVRKKPTRPLLQTDNPYETLSRILNDRIPHYSDADIAVQSESRLTVGDMAEKVLAALASTPSELSAFSKAAANGD